MVDYITDEDKTKKDKNIVPVKTVKEVVVESLEEESTKAKIAEEKAAEEADLTLKTVTELKALAKKQGIKGYSTMKKDDLIKVLK
ncbi:MAG: Rho termination factor N-terminal domain-containing protein [Bacilli bacterium]|nr:Rho termination factor N-terminal domain-containing protein [Bacilli bacterium]